MPLRINGRDFTYYPSTNDLNGYGIVPPEEACIRIRRSDGHYGYVGLVKCSNTYPYAPNTQHPGVYSNVRVKKGSQYYAPAVASKAWLRNRSNYDDYITYETVDFGNRQSYYTLPTNLYRLYITSVQLRRTGFGAYGGGGGGGGAATWGIFGNNRRLCSGGGGSAGGSTKSYDYVERLSSTILISGAPSSNTRLVVNYGTLMLNGTSNASGGAKITGGASGSAITGGAGSQGAAPSFDPSYVGVSFFVKNYVTNTTLHHFAYDTDEFEISDRLVSWVETHTKSGGSAAFIASDGFGPLVRGGRGGGSVNTRSGSGGNGSSSKFPDHDTTISGGSGQSGSSIGAGGGNGGSASLSSDGGSVSATNGSSGSGCTYTSHPMKPSGVRFKAHGYVLGG